jgi:hypothetical protein
MLATWGCSTFPKPTLSLDFLGATSLDAGITFTRGSQATLFDSTGTLVYAKHNLLLQSQNFATSWTTARVSINATAGTAPDGTNTANSLLQAAGQTTAGTISQSVTVTPVSHSISIYAKPSGKNWLAIRESLLDGSAKTTWFNVQTGTIGTTAIGHTASIVSVDNAFYRCVITFTVNLARTGVAQFFICDADNSISVADDGLGLYLWGAQLNLSNMEGGVTSSLSTYYPTTTAAYYAPRFTYNPSTLAPQGLLIEEQRTNLEPNSEALTSVLGASILTNVTTAPSGSVTADKLVEDTSTGAHQVTTASISWVGNTAYTFTIFLKADTRSQVQIAFGTSSNWVAGQRNAQFDVLNGTVLGTAGANITASIDAVGNGWYRCRMTCTTVAVPVASTVQIQMYVSSSASYTGNGTSGLFFWGAQVEAGSFPTSYIPTSGTTLTRNADVASMTGTNFSSWYNQSEGTFVANGVSFGGAVAGLYSASNGTSAQSVSVRLQQQFSFAQGLNRASFTYTTNSIARHGFAYKANDYAAAFNGTALTISAQPTAVPTTANVLNIGTLETGVFSLNGTIQRISYYPTRLPNATLQALTS